MASRVIIVTGASRGIGLAVARDLIQASHKVVLVARSESELAALKKQNPSQVEYKVADLTKFEVRTYLPLKPEPARHTEHRLDFRPSTQVAPIIVDLAVKTFGRLDGVVINHGVLSPMTRIADCNVDEWRQLFDANFFSAIALVSLCLAEDAPGYLADGICSAVQSRDPSASPDIGADCLRLIWSGTPCLRFVGSVWKLQGRTQLLGRARGC